MLIWSQNVHWNWFLFLIMNNRRERIYLEGRGKISKLVNNFLHKCVVLAMRRAPVACPANYILPDYFINSTYFGRNSLNVKCVFWFSLQLSSKTFLIVRRIQWDVIIKVHTFSCKLLHYACHTLMELEFSWQIFKISKKKPNLLTHQPMGAELFHEDEQTDILNLTAAFVILWKCLKREHTTTIHNLLVCLSLYI